MKCTLKKFTDPWTKSCLYKPSGEHTKLPTIVTLPRGDIDKVELLDKNKKHIQTAKFRSVGSAGDAWSLTGTTSVRLAKKYKTGYLRLLSGKVCRLYHIKNFLQRSDEIPNVG